MSDMNLPAIERRSTKPLNVPSIRSLRPSVVPPGTEKSRFNTTIFTKKFNVLLVFLPLGIIADKLNWHGSFVFVLNFLAILPLTRLHGYVADDICLRRGKIPGTLLASTLRNGVEFILTVIVLKSGKITVVQASILGSILFDLLLALGCCFMVGGFHFSSQSYSAEAAQTSAALLDLACGALLILTAFNGALRTPDLMDTLQISKGASIVLLVLYACYILFQLGSHTRFYSIEHEEEEEEYLFKFWQSVALLLLFTVAIAFCGDYLVNSMDGLSISWGLKPTFIGMILLPFVSKITELSDTVAIARRNQMDWVLQEVIGSSIQTSLLITPLLVVVGWILGQPMTLDFDIFPTSVLVFSVIIVNCLIKDGESNWLKGMLLIAAYTITAIAMYV